VSRRPGPPRRTPATLPRLPMLRNRWVRARIYAVASLMTLLFGAVAYKAYGIQISDTERYRKLARKQHMRTLEVPTPRGVIYDTRGAELAVTANVDSVFASPREISNVAGTAESLAEMLDLDVRSLEAKLSSRRYFVWIKRRVSPADATAVRELGLPGVQLTPEPKRFYPSKALAATVLGFANIDGKGLDGVELSMDDLLAGKRAKLAALRDAHGKVSLADGMAPFQPGASIVLTLDRSIQFIAERALKQAIETHRARAGTVVVLDVGTAEVLAMANWPTFNPNAPGDPGRKRARNRAVTDAFEVGSAMKIFTVAAALEAGVVTTRTIIDVEHGRLKVGRKVIRDSHRDWELTIGGIIKRSSNVGAVKIARRLGAEALHAALHRYGFGQKTGIELPGERAGVLRKPEKWGGQLGLATMSFGYGMTATPIQVAAAFAAIGNGGIYQEPRLIKTAMDSEGSSLYDHQPIGRRIMSERTAADLRNMLASVFEKGKHGGTARSVDVIGFRAGGKTGTAHKVDPTTRRYGDHLYVASFVGMAPIEAPRIVVLVLIDEPTGKKHYGAQVAAPAFAQIVSETLRYLGVPAEKELEPEEPAAPPTREVTPAEASDDETPSADTLSDALVMADDDSFDDGYVIPDFHGLGMARALDLARSIGLEAEVEGTGRAVSQNPAPGLTRGPAKCRIVFERDSSNRDQRIPEVGGHAKE